MLNQNKIQISLQVDMSQTSYKTILVAPLIFDSIIFTQSYPESNHLVN